MHYNISRAHSIPENLFKKKKKYIYIYTTLPENEPSPPPPLRDGMTPLYVAQRGCPV